MIIDRLTWPLQGVIIALRFRVPYVYACRTLQLAAQLDAGAISEQEFLRSGARLSEHYPEAYTRTRAALGLGGGGEV